MLLFVGWLISCVASRSGSTGPSSQWPHGEEGERWATRFPTLSLFDMVRAQLDLLDSLGIDQLYASIGSSMGGMQSLALAYLDPARVGRVASISATGRSGLGGVGMRFAQRSGELDPSGINEASSIVLIGLGRINSSHVGSELESRVLL